MRKLMVQMIKFAMTGGISFVVDYGLMIFLTEQMAFNYLVSSAISFCVSVILNYILSVKWVFDTNPSRSKKRTFLIFLVFSVFGLGINEGLMWFGVTHLQMHYMIVKLFAAAVVMVFNFITRKLFLE